MILLNNPAFVAYAIACAVLCTNLMALWGYSGAVRARTKTAVNEEDAAKFGVALVPNDPPPVARVLRAHANAEASIFPFLFLGLVFVLAGGGAAAATVMFTIFTVARLLHSIAYLRELQPWRTIFFVAGALVIVALVISIAWLVARTS